MSFRFCDSFDHYTTAQIFRKWTVAPNTTINTISGRSGGGALVQGAGGQCSKTLDHQSEWFLGVAFTEDTEPTSVGLLFIANCSTGLCTLVMNADHTFSIVAGNGGVVATSEFALEISFGSYNYAELHAVLSGSNPILLTATAKINGQVVATCSNSSTATNSSSLLSDSATANVVGVGAAVNSFCHMTYDDFYACDGQVDGFGHNAFLGDVRIEYILPNADVTTNFTKVGGDGTHAYTCVNDVPPDDDTSYIHDATAGDTEEFDWQSISSFAGTVVAVQYSVYARKDDEGSKTFKSTQNGSAFGTLFYMSDFYVYYINALDSDGGVAWTVTNFNSTTWGLKVES